MQAATARLVGLTSGAVLLGTVAGVMLAGAQSVFPVRFAGDTPAAVSIAASDDHILDPHITIASSQGTSIVLQPISFSTMIRYCGDGDGCRLRLFMSPTGDARAIQLKTAELAVNTTGTLYTIWASTTLSGSTVDGDSQTMLSGSLGDRQCGFWDWHQSHTYEVRAENLSSVLNTDCVLRIDD